MSQGAKTCVNALKLQITKFIILRFYTLKWTKFIILQFYTLKWTVSVILYAPQMSRGQMFVGPCQDLPGNIIDYKYLIPNLYHATDGFGGKQS